MRTNERLNILQIMRKLLVFKDLSYTIIDMQLRILEQQYQSVLNGTTLPTEGPCIIILNYSHS